MLQNFFRRVIFLPLTNETEKKDQNVREIEEIKLVMEEISRRDDILGRMGIIMEKEMELSRLEGIIGMLARGVTHQLPVGNISLPTINVRNMFSNLTTGKSISEQPKLTKAEINRMYEKKMEYLNLKHYKEIEIMKLKDVLRTILEPASYKCVVDCMDLMKISLMNLYKGSNNRAFENANSKWLTNDFLLRSCQRFYSDVESGKTILSYKTRRTEKFKYVSPMNMRNANSNSIINSNANDQDLLGKKSNSSSFSISSSTATSQQSESSIIDQQNNIIPYQLLNNNKQLQLLNNNKQHQLQELPKDGIKRSLSFLTPNFEQAENNTKQNKDIDEDHEMAEGKENKINNYFNFITKEEAMENAKKNLFKSLNSKSIAMKNQTKIMKPAKIMKSTKITNFFKKKITVRPDHRNSGNSGNNDSGFDDGTMGNGNGHQEINKKEVSPYFRAADGTVYNSIQAQPLNLSILKPN